MFVLKRCSAFCSIAFLCLVSRSTLEKSEPTPFVKCKVDCVFFETLQSQEQHKFNEISNTYIQFIFTRNYYYYLRIVLTDISQFFHDGRQNCIPCDFHTNVIVIVALIAVLIIIPTHFIHFFSQEESLSAAEEYKKSEHFCCGMLVVWLVIVYLQAKFWFNCIKKSCFISFHYYKPTNDHRHHHQFGFDLDSSAEKCIVWLDFPWWYLVTDDYTAFWKSSQEQKWARLGCFLYELFFFFISKKIHILHLAKILLKQNTIRIFDNKVILL